MNITRIFRAPVSYLLILALSAGMLAGCSDAGNRQPQAVQTTEPACSRESLPVLPDVGITSVTEEAAPALHCKVTGVIGTETHFELLLPENWNGKFAMGGGGGFVGSVINWALLFGALQSGYATVGTDTGHQAHSLDASWALNDLERIVSFGHQAVHRTAVTSPGVDIRILRTGVVQGLFRRLFQGRRSGAHGSAALPRGFRRHCPQAHPLITGRTNLARGTPGSIRSCTRTRIILRLPSSARTRPN